MRPLGVQLQQPRSRLADQVMQPPRTIADAVMEGAGELTAPPLRRPNELGQWVRDELGNPDSKMRQDMMQAAMLAPFGITAFHGSPHKFDKFDMSKIGSGEGAQAYGHGLYFAENPAVAKEYAVTLSADRRQSLSTAVGRMNGEVKDLQMVQDILSGKSPWPNNTKGVPVSREFLEKSAADRADSIKTLESLQTKLKDLNNMYKVDIPDEAVGKMLDWDKPLSQQPESVRKALGGYRLPDVATGKQIVDMLQNRAMSALEPSARRGLETYAKDAAEELRKLGIPGLKYLDQGSRAGGQGTSNYVLFDDTLPKILERK